MSEFDIGTGKNRIIQVLGGNLTYTTCELTRT